VSLGLVRVRTSPPLDYPNPTSLLQLEDGVNQMDQGYACYCKKTVVL